MSFSGDNNIHTGDNTEEKFTPRVAYTLGSNQSVRSTYIAHDPFFFADIDDEILEEEDFFEIENLMLEDDKSEAEFFNSYNESENLLNIMEAFDENMDAYDPDVSLTDTKTSFDEICAILEKSRYANTLLKQAQNDDVIFEASNTVFSGVYNKSSNTIIYNPSLSTLETVKVFVSTLCQYWQAKSGALMHPLSFYPDHAIFVYRAQSADLATTLLRTGWELYLAGYEDLWNDLEKGALSDMARSFAREAAIDFRTLNNGNATYAAFETWFLSDRSRICDNQLVQRLLSGEYKGPSIEDEDMSAMVLAEFIGALGDMPYGKNYLASFTPHILNDPVFMDIRERSNANFLWFVKFEKTFREMEQGLQSVEDLPEGTTVSSRSHHFDSSEDYHDQEMPSEGKLLHFPREFKRQESENPNATPAIFSKNGTAVSSADIIPFDIAVRPFNTNF